MRLRIHHPDTDTEPYPIRSAQDLRDAIEAEAETVANDAGSDLLDDPGDAAREQLKERIMREAWISLSIARTYTDPTGIRWTLVREHTPG